MQHFSDGTRVTTCVLRVVCSRKSHLSAVTEKITGRHKDTCPLDATNRTGYSKGNANRDMGNANMDIVGSEIACERLYN